MSDQPTASPTESVPDVAGRVIELARLCRQVRRAGGEFLRRWAEEQEAGRPVDGRANRVADLLRNAR